MFGYDCTRLFFLIAFSTLAKLAGFFLVVVFDGGRWTRIVGAASSSMKSNSKSLLSLINWRNMREKWNIHEFHRNRLLSRLHKLQRNSINRGILFRIFVHFGFGDHFDRCRRPSARALPAQFKRFASLQLPIHCVQFVFSRLELFIVAIARNTPVVRCTHLGHTLTLFRDALLFICCFLLFC